MNTVAVKLQYAVAKDGIPASKLISQWVKSAINYLKINLTAEITVRIVGKKEITDLNYRYRNQAKPTNVLSFSYPPPHGTDLPLCGDIVICASVVFTEAINQSKEVNAHWAHLIIHGTLHIFGFDHEDSDQANHMENIETQILAQLGYPDPYQEKS